jgi:hypothetical protein
MLFVEGVFLLGVFLLACFVVLCVCVFLMQGCCFGLFDFLTDLVLLGHFFPALTVLACFFVLGVFLLGVFLLLCVVLYYVCVVFSTWLDSSYWRFKCWAIVSDYSIYSPSDRRLIVQVC